KRGEFLRIRAKNNIIALNDLTGALQKFSYDELDCALMGFRRMTSATERRMTAICGPVTKMGILPTLLASMVVMNQFFPGFNIGIMAESGIAYYILPFILALLFVQ